MHYGNVSITLVHPFVLFIIFLLFFLMTAMASASMLATCVSFPVAVFMVRALHIRVVIQCFINEGFYCLICIP